MKHKLPKIIAVILGASLIWCAGGFNWITWLLYTGDGDYNIEAGEFPFGGFLRNYRLTLPEVSLSKTSSHEFVIKGLAGNRGRFWARLCISSADTTLWQSVDTVLDVSITSPDPISDDKMVEIHLAPGEYHYVGSNSHCVSLHGPNKFPPLLLDRWQTHLVNIKVINPGPEFADAKVSVILISGWK